MTKFTFPSSAIITQMRASLCPRQGRIAVKTVIACDLQQLKNSILYFLAGSIVINIRQYDDPPELAANQDRLYAGPGN